MELKKTRLFFIEHYKFDHIMKYDNQYYLMNVDEPFKLLLWFLPFLEWLLPHKFYLIDKQTAQKLLFESQEHQYSHTLVIGFIMACAPPITTWLMIHC